MFDFQLRYRNRAPEMIRKTRLIQQLCYACTEYNYDWSCNDLEEPYTTPADKPFSWLGRMRVTGGRTNVWGRISLRFSELDFKAASQDGFGEDWPLSYKDLEPYYDLRRAEDWQLHPHPQRHGPPGLIGCRQEPRRGPALH